MALNMNNNNEFIDVEDALRRIGGNMDLYRRLLGRFVDGNNIEAIESALINGDMEESARLVHTLKGVSANLSLVGVRTASINLEQALKDGLDYISRYAELKLVFYATLERISEMLS